VFPVLTLCFIRIHVVLSLKFSCIKCRCQRAWQDQSCSFS